MEFEFAPMEGITTYLYRNAYHKHFTPADRYFTPFVAPNMNHGLNAKELRDVHPDNNAGIPVIPQVLTNRADYFFVTCQELADLGYTEVNLNFGCPSGTVVAKNRGAGFLSERDAMRAFLDEVFEHAPIDVSIKTRVGRYDESEWPELLDIYRHYPCKELIIHPRIQKDFYKGLPRMHCFDAAVDSLPFPVVFNGNLFTPNDIQSFSESYPQVRRVMVGRGLICNPWLLGGTPDMKVLNDFHEELLSGYGEIMSGDAQVICKLKGIWTYLIQSFTNYSKYQKTIRKTRSLSEYRSTVSSLLHNEQFIPNTSFIPEK